MTNARKRLKLIDLYNKICQTVASSIILMPSPTVDHKTPAINTKIKPLRCSIELPKSFVSLI
jgi:hypothetical protein